MLQHLFNNNITIIYVQLQQQQQLFRRSHVAGDVIGSRHQRTQHRRLSITERSAHDGAAMCPHQETKPIGKHTRLAFVSGPGTGSAAASGTKGPETGDE